VYQFLHCNTCSAACAAVALTMAMACLAPASQNAKIAQVNKDGTRLVWLGSAHVCHVTDIADLSKIDSAYGSDIRPMNMKAITRVGRLTVGQVPQGEVGGDNTWICNGSHAFVSLFGPEDRHYVFDPSIAQFINAKKASKWGWRTKLFGVPPRSEYKSALQAHEFQWDMKMNADDLFEALMRNVADLGFHDFDGVAGALAALTV
jgi:hypothetical protein